MKKYVVINDIDQDEMGEFDSRKEAQEFIRESKRFDKEQGNPFNETYSIEVREE